MAQLAILGHKTRGKEVIEILEILGYINYHNYSASDDSLCFYGNRNTKWISYVWINNCYDDKDVTIFTLEEFLEKYPYKVGDEVVDKCGVYGSIVSMRWEQELNCVRYQVSYYNKPYDTYWWESDDLKPYKEEITMEDKGTLVQIDLTREQSVSDEIEVILGDYEIVLRNGKTYFIKKKPQYPKTYEACCEVLSLPLYYNLRYHTYEYGFHEFATIDKLCSLQDKLNILGKLYICRNAYWKIAGEEMGLGKPWEPDWKDDNDKYFICYLKDKLWMSNIRDCNRFLVFPTKEMQDAFYENFKELIEACKDFL